MRVACAAVRGLSTHIETTEGRSGREFMAWNELITQVMKNRTPKPEVVR